MKGSEKKKTVQDVRNSILEEAVVVVVMVTGRLERTGRSCEGCICSWIQPTSEPEEGGPTSPIGWSQAACPESRLLGDLSGAESLGDRGPQESPEDRRAEGGGGR